MQADSDDQYRAYTHRVSGNSALLDLDIRANGFDAWRRAADLTGADYFLAGYENQSIELRRIDSYTATTNLGTASFVHAQAGTLPAQTAELTIPWTQLGFSSKPTTPGAQSAAAPGHLHPGSDLHALKVRPDRVRRPCPYFTPQSWYT